MHWHGYVRYGGTKGSWSSWPSSCTGFQGHWVIINSCVHRREPSWWRTTVWCSELGSLTSLDAPELHASSDVNGPISLHQAVHVYNINVFKPSFHYGSRVHYVMVSKIQWIPVWLAPPSSIYKMTWLDCVAKWCERWRMCQGPTAFSSDDFNPLTVVDVYIRQGEWRRPTDDVYIRIWLIASFFVCSSLREL